MTARRVAGSAPGRGTGRRVLGGGALLTMQLMLGADATVVNVALPQIRVSLGFSTETLSEVVSAYSVAFASLILLSGQVGSRVGGRRTLMVGACGLGVASLVGGVAWSPWVLVASRAGQGIGAALAAPAILVLLVQSSPTGRARQRAVASYALVSVSGGAVGLVAGGLLVALGSWRAALLVNVPMAALVLFGALRGLREGPRSRGRLDFGGALTTSVMMLALVAALTAGSSLGWSHPVVLLALAVGAVCVVFVPLVERRRIDPVLELAALSSPHRAVPIVATGLVSAALFGFFYFITLFLQRTLHFSPWEAGLALLPFNASIIGSTSVVSSAAAWIGNRACAVAGLLVCSAALFWLSKLNSNWPYLPDILIPTVLLGLGVGFTFAPLTALAVQASPPSRVSSVAALVQAAQQLGGAAGLAALTAVFAGAAASSGFTAGVSTALQGAAAASLLGAVLLAAQRRRRPPTVRRESVALPPRQGDP
jgi:MFS family permease